MRVNISIDEELLKQVDVYAAEHNTGRSELIADSLEEKMRPKNSAEVGEKWNPKVLESILKANELVAKLESMVGIPMRESSYKIEAVKKPHVEIQVSPQPLSNDFDIPGMGTYKEPVEGKPITGWCQLHFEKGVNYPLRKINWEDENGVEVVSKKFACPKCVKHYEDMGRGRVYFI